MNQSNLVLSLKQILSLVAVNGDLKSYIIEGPMGSGKSSIIKMAKDRFGDKYNYVTVDCTQWDVGDVAIPDIDKEELVVRHLPNVLLVGTNGKPMFINLDEFGKASRPVQNALLPVVLERRVGVRYLPEGSIVCGATNLGAEGVGDLFQAHSRNRVSFLEMRYPTNMEWIEWGIDNGVEASMLAWANENPQLFHSFKDVPRPDDNPYIFHPKDNRKSFCTPRSMYLASIELQEDRRARVNDHTATLAGIAGNIGVKAALDLMAFVELADAMPRWDRIISDPLTAKVPHDNPAAIVLTAIRAVAKVEKSTLTTTMQYIQRCPQEIQCIFATQLMRVQSKSAFTAMNGEFTKWVNENHWLLA
jgi:hypothetical protein